jgi:hypothetical protein
MTKPKAKICSLAYQTLLQGLMLLVLATGVAGGVPHSVQAQINRPPSILLGGAIGTGGLYDFFKYSFDVHFRLGGRKRDTFYGLNGVYTTLRLAPGLHYLSMGVSQRVGYYRSFVRRQERPIIASVYYHRDYFLNSINNPGRERQVAMAMVGIRANLDRIQRVYCEAALGAMYVRENEAADKYFPMVEFRLGGIVQRHVKTYAKRKKK